MDRPTVINKTDHEIICQGNGFVVRRVGRFLLGELQAPHRVLSTSIHGGGQSESIQYVINHQSCEVAGHAERQVLLSELGQIGYHNQVCKELGLPPDEVALMGTAANMRYAVHRNERYEELAVDAVVTAGVEGNAVRAGDEAHWVETENGWEKISPYNGTINIMLFFNWPLTAAAQVCAAVTMTEAKSAALQELAVASRYSEHLATGTGTDQFIIAAPLNDDRKPKESTGPHAKLGEMIGRAVLGAIKEALRWQNGLEASYTRSIFHALRRFGLTREHLMERIAPLLSSQELALLKQNDKAVFYDPQIAACAYAYAAVLDRVRYGTIPSGLASEVLRQQAANIASTLAAKPGQWTEYWRQLSVDEQDPAAALVKALALGWKTKWT